MAGPNIGPGAGYEAVSCSRFSRGARPRPASSGHNSTLLLRNCRRRRLGKPAQAAQGPGVQAALNLQFTCSVAPKAQFLQIG